MVNVPRRVAAVIAGNPKKTQEWIYQLLLAEVTEACKVLGDPNKEKPPNPNDPQSQASNHTVGRG